MYVRKGPAISDPDDVVRAKHREVQPGQGGDSKPQRLS